MGLYLKGHEPSGGRDEIGLFGRSSNWSLVVAEMVLNSGFMERNGVDPYSGILLYIST